MKFVRKKEDNLNELEVLRRRNEELEIKLKEYEANQKLTNGYNLETLTLKEKPYKALFENTDDGFEIIELIYDSSDRICDYRWIKVNNAWERQVGLNAYDIVGKKASEVFSVVGSYWLEKYHRVYKTGQSLRYENYGRDTRRWFDCLCFPIVDKKIGILFRDITNVKQAEKCLKDNEKLYRTMFENTEDAFHIAEVIYDENKQPIDYKFIKTNKIWDKQTDLNAADVLGKRVKHIFPDVESYWIEIYDRILKSDKSLHYDNYNESTKKWYSMVGFPYSNTEVGILFRDITKQKEYENKLALQAEILTNIQDAVVVYDEKDTIIYYNKAFMTLFGCNEDEIIGELGFEFLYDHIDSRSKLKFEEVLKKNSYLPDIFQLTELCCLCKGGKKIIIDLNMSKLKDQDGDYKGLIISLRDVSQRVEDLKKLQKSERNSLELIEKLRTIDENKNEFLNTFSHEIRNPMAAAMMSLALLNNASTNSVLEIKAKETLNRQLQHLSSLVDDLLDVTRIKTNKVRLNKEEININEVVQNVVMDHKANYDAKDVALEYELSDFPLYIEGDSVRIVQVLDNLLNNSMKFTQKGGKTFIKVEKEENIPQVKLTIKDTGIGISPDSQHDLFDPFVQLDTSLERSSGGLGLGLAIVNGMVELHGGSVEVYSEGIGKGTLFTIKLPLIDEAVEKKEYVSKQDINAPSNLNILIIDDNKDLTEIMCEMIVFLGYSVESALNGQDGLMKARELKPDVVICDIGLPVMNGYEVAKNIRNDESIKDTYLIALSGYAQAEDIERSLKAGFNRHLAKPMTLNTLKSTLKECKYP